MFLADLIAGNIPDLVDLSETDVYLALKNRGLLENLNDYLERDGELSKDDFIEQSLEFYGEKGKVYGIPYALILHAMMGDATYLGDRKAWTLEEFRDFLDDLPDPQMVTKALTKQEMLRELVKQYWGCFIDQEGHRCNFQSKEFREILELSSVFSEEDGEDENLEEALITWNQVKNGELILMADFFSGAGENYVTRSTMFPGKGRLIGFPTAQGNGISLTHNGLAVAMISSGQHKEEAWEFIKYEMTHEKPGFDYLQFTSYQPLFEKKRKEQLEASDQLEAGAMRDLLENGTVISAQEEVILELIAEEAEGYFHGAKTAQQIAEILEGRIGLYLTE